MSICPDLLRYSRRYDMSVVMDIIEAIEAFDALAQRTRLQTLKLLVQAGDGGVPAGDLAKVLGVPHNTMSAHLAVLTTAGLAVSERQGRSIIYRAKYETLRGLIDYLMMDCCQGLPEIIGSSEKETCCERNQS